MSALPIEQIFKYVNEARTKPKSFAQYVQKDIDSFVDQQRMPLAPNFYYSTNQGISAWKQCLSFLMNASPLPPYKFSQALNLTAMDHAIDMAKTGIQGHRGSDGSTLTDRIQKRCGDFDGGSWAENIGSQFDIQGRNHVLKTVLGLIIDDGVSSRGHRQNIFSKEYEYIGIYSVMQGDKIKTVMNFHSEDLQLADDDDSNDDDNHHHHKKEEPKTPNNYNQPNINSYNNKKNPQQGNWQNNHNSNNDIFPGFYNQQQNQPNSRQYLPQFSQMYENYNQKQPNTYNGQFGNQPGNQIGIKNVYSTNKDKPKKTKKVKIGSEIQEQSSMQNGKWVTKRVQTIKFSDGSVEKHETVLNH